MNEVLQVISDRRSIRSYDPAPLPKSDIEAIMKAALESPTARNSQLWHFSVVTNRGILDELDDAVFTDRSVTFKAPMLVVITAPKERGFFTKIDCGIAVENIALAAWSLGYGSVILGFPKKAFEGDKAGYFMEKLEIPADHEFIIAIAIGKALSSKEAHELHPEKISYIE